MGEEFNVDIYEPQPVKPKRWSVKLERDGQGAIDLVAVVRSD